MATSGPLVVKAALAHLWFITLHPFDDGNGRIARAISDLFLSRADGSPQRFHSLSAQIQRERSRYYEMLERPQKGELPVHHWVTWFLEALLAWGVLRRTAGGGRSTGYEVVPAPTG